MGARTAKVALQKETGASKKRLRVLLSITLIATLAFSLLAGCQPKTTEQEALGSEQQAPVAQKVGPVTFTDDLDNEITVEDPQRVVATMGSLGMIWELAGGTLVGISDDVDTSSNYYQVSSDVQRIGDFTSIDLDKVIALEPDLVIMTSATTGRADTADQLGYKDALGAAGITAAYFTVTTFQDYLRMMNVCTQITGRIDLFRTNAADVKSNIETTLSLVAAVSGSEKPRVLLLTTYSDGVRVQNTKTQTGSMLSFLNTVNIANENPSLLTDFSLEAVLEANPDFIFVVPMGENSEAAQKHLKELTSHPVWGQLGAVKNGDFFTLQPELFLYKPNERWGDAYEALFNYLYMVQEA